MEGRRAHLNRLRFEKGSCAPDAEDRGEAEGGHEGQADAGETEIHYRTIEDQAREGVFEETAMRTLVGRGALMLVASAAAAQPCPTPPVTYQDQWCVAIKAIVALPKDQLDKQSDVEDLIELQAGNLGAFLLYAQSRAQSVDIRQIEDNRTDKQVGSPGNAVGSTSAVSKGAVPGVLGFAVENGALTQAVSGTTVTLRGNLVGWLDLVQNQGFIAAYQDDSPIVRQLRRVSYSFTLNTDTGTGADASPPASAGSAPTPSANS